MKYGYFDDKNKEYVITRPDTPIPWINYLGSEDFFGIISNTAGGYSFFQDAKLRRLTRYRYNSIPMDNNGRYLYIQDGDEKWTPMWKPMRVDLDHYECRHGLGYTTITARKNDVEVMTTFFVPLGYRHEVWMVSVKNLSDKPKNLRLWSFVEWCLWDAMDDMTNFQRNFNIGEVEVEDSTIFHKTEYRERRNHYAYFSVNREISGYDTNRDDFIGMYSGLEMPNVVKEGVAKNSVAHGWAPIGSHQLDLNIPAGGEEKMTFLLGYAENDKDKKFTAPNVIRKDEFNTIKSKFEDNTAAEKAFTDLKLQWEEWLSVYQAETSDVEVNRSVNIWNQYQCMATLNFSRSTSFFESGIGRGMGYRDSNQDVLGYVHYQPERARQRILDIASTQQSNGTCFHQYQPLTKKGNSDIGGGFMDDHLWLILSTTAYLKETGDLSILDEKIGYADLDDKSATLMDHLELSIDFTIQNLGPHGLPLIGHADWNDCLNLNCYSDTPGESFQTAESDGDSQTAESVMIAGLFCRACDDMEAIYKVLKKEDLAKATAEKAAAMRQTIYKHGWDGDWFKRAYDANGHVIGSKVCDEGQIFIEPQGWCILGRAGLENGYAKKALDSVKERLFEPNGIKLHQPAYQSYHLNLGEISSYPPGHKENAGIFTHNNTWVQVAETMVGNGDRAMEYYKSILPSTKQEQIDIYKAEPYVYSQVTAGKDSPKQGEGKNSWLTGTAAWSFVAISQAILGVQPEFDGLKIDPCIPKEWKEFKVTRKFRNATYEITVTNPNNISKGVKSVTVDGKAINGNILPIFGDDKVHQVAVVLG